MQTEERRPKTTAPVQRFAASAWSRCTVPPAAPLQARAEQYRSKAMLWRRRNTFQSDSLLSISLLTAKRIVMCFSGASGKYQTRQSHGDAAAGAFERRCVTTHSTQTAYRLIGMRLTSQSSNKLPLSLVSARRFAAIHVGWNRSRDPLGFVWFIVPRLFLLPFS